MNLLLWFIVGIGIASIVTLLERRRKKNSISLNSVLAVLGSLVGGFLSSLLVDSPTYHQTIFTLAIASLCALFFLVESKKILTSA